MEEFQKFAQTAEEIYRNAGRENRLILNPSSDELRKLSLQEPEIKETKYGSLACNSEPTSRAAIHTKNNIDYKFEETEYLLLKQAKDILNRERLVSIDVLVGDNTNITGRFIVPERFAHLAYMGNKQFKLTSYVENPTYYVIMFFDEEYKKNKSKKLADKSITIRLAHSPEGKLVKIVRNANYFGEIKKGVFAGEDYRAKLKGNAIFLHAGCREDTLDMWEGSIKTQCSLFVALSANGKTALTCRYLAKKSNEKSWLIQDDGGTLYMDSSFGGFEAGAVFAKTENLSPDPDGEREIYCGALKPNTFLENVYVNENGEVDFTNLTKTSNGRAIIERRDIMHASPYINIDRIDNLFIITRGDIIPAIAKLTLEEAVAYMVLGQSMESSAGNPEEAGKIKNEFFYDPFIAGNRSEHANLFYEILKANSHINCYLLNTGHVGDTRLYSYHNIKLEHTLGILDSVLRGGLENIWVKSPATELFIPKAVRTVDDIFFHPEKLFPEDIFKKKQKALEEHRKKLIESYSGLDEKVRTVFLRLKKKKKIICFP